MDENKAFFDRTKAQVLAYLEHSKVEYRRLGVEPAWFLMPHIAVWEVFGRSETPGWFAITGDLPTDYVSSADASTPRDAVRAFARLWKEAAGLMAVGKPHPSFRIGAEQEWPRLSPMLEARAELLEDFAADDSLWE